MSSSTTNFKGDNTLDGFSVQSLFSLITNATASAQAQLKIIQNQTSAVSIAQMFNMQMLMNHLSQLSEMTTAVVAASNSSILSMTRNLKA